METLMAERLGIRAAARLAGDLNPVVLYVAVARKTLHADVVDGQLLFEPGDLKLWRAAMDAEKAAREQKSIAERDARFRAVNTRRESKGNNGR
jgi:hypothetical protein